MALRTSEGRRTAPAPRARRGGVHAATSRRRPGGCSGAGLSARGLPPPSADPAGWREVWTLRLPLYEDVILPSGWVPDAHLPRADDEIPTRHALADLASTGASCWLPHAASGVDASAAGAVRPRKTVRGCFTVITVGLHRQTGPRGETAPSRLRPQSTSARLAIDDKVNIKQLFNRLLLLGFPSKGAPARALVKIDKSCCGSPRADAHHLLNVDHLLSAAAPAHGDGVRRRGVKTEAELPHRYRAGW